MAAIGGKRGRPRKDPGDDDNKDGDKSGKSPPQPIADDEVEDGDIATPKRDRHGDDDQPL